MDLLKKLLEKSVLRKSGKNPFWNSWTNLWRKNVEEILEMFISEYPKGLIFLKIILNATWLGQIDGIPQRFPIEFIWRYLQELPNRFFEGFLRNLSKKFQEFSKIFVRNPSSNNLKNSFETSCRISFRWHFFFKNYFIILSMDSFGALKVSPRNFLWDSSRSFYSLNTLNEI